MSNRGKKILTAGALVPHSLLVKHTGKTAELTWTGWAFLGSYSCRLHLQCAWKNKTTAFLTLSLMLLKTLCNSLPGIFIRSFHVSISDFLHKA